MKAFHLILLFLILSQSINAVGEPSLTLSRDEMQRVINALSKGATLSIILFQIAVVSSGAIVLSIYKECASGPKCPGAINILSIIPNLITYGLAVSQYFRFQRIIDTFTDRMSV